MNRKLHLAYLLGFLFLLLGFACKPEKDLPSREELIQRALDKKLAKYRQTHARRCQKTIFQEAKIIVDSVMLANASSVQVIDSITRPPKPEKPPIPEPKTLKDTLEVGPLLPVEK